MYVVSGAIGFFTVHEVLGINHLSWLLIFQFFTFRKERYRA